MKLINICLLFLIIDFSFIVYANGIGDDPSILTLDRIYGSKEFTLNSLPPFSWWKGGEGYTIVENSPKISAGEDLVLYDSPSGKRKVIVSAQELIPPGKSHPLKIEDYTWSQDGQKLLIFTNTRRVWRYNTRGDYWVLNLNSGKLTSVGSSLEKSDSKLMFAKFSPDSLKIGYVFQNNIYVEFLENNTIKQLTFDGSDVIINGTSDWVNEEEFSLEDGFRWSPDSKQIAFWHYDSNGVGQFHMINNTDELYPTITTIPYPKAGTTNSSIKIGVVNIDEDSKSPTWFKIKGDPRHHYITALEWLNNYPSSVVLQRLNRKQNHMQFIYGHANTGETKIIYEEQSNTWIDVDNKIHWLDNGNTISWINEQDQWRHAYQIPLFEGRKQLLTLMDFDLIKLLHIDKKNHCFYFIASPQNPTQRYLYQMKFSLKGHQNQVQRLTPKFQNGYHRYKISPNAKWAFHTFSKFGTPKQVELIQLPDHRPIRTLISNKKLRLKIKTLKKTAAEFFKIDIGNGVKLDGWIMKPYNFDPQKKYPLLLYIYSEPGTQTVLDRWSRYYLWHLMLTQKGFLVASIDPRGTPGPKGTQWRKSIYKQIGILTSKDLAAATQKILKKWEFINAQKIAVWGWSGGGSMALNLIFRYPQLYSTAIAVAPVSDLRLYDSIYQERYMSLPQENPEGYKIGSPINFAKNLKGNLLLIHGTGDDNVHYQGLEMLVNELIRHNKIFTTMSYPNRSHDISEGENTRRHLYEMMTHFLLKHMPPD